MYVEHCLTECGLVYVCDVYHPKAAVDSWGVVKGVKCSDSSDVRKRNGINISKTISYDTVVQASTVPIML